MKPVNGIFDASAVIARHDFKQISVHGELHRVVCVLSVVSALCLRPAEFCVCDGVKVFRCELFPVSQVFRKDPVSGAVLRLVTVF